MSTPQVKAYTKPWDLVGNDKGKDVIGTVMTIVIITLPSLQSPVESSCPDVP